MRLFLVGLAAGVTSGVLISAGYPAVAAGLATGIGYFGGRTE